MTPTIYINLEDDVASIAARIQRQRSEQVVLVCPKRCFLFSDPINLKLLKTQTDLFGKEVFILTMDEKGRSYAEAAGFGLRQVPGAPRTAAISDIKPAVKEAPAANGTKTEKHNLLAEAAHELKNFAQSLVAAEPEVQRPAASPTKGPRVSTASKDGVAPVSDAVSEEVPDAVIRDTIFPKEIQETIRLERKTKHNRRLAAVLAVGAVALVLVVMFVVLPKAVVVVYPRVEPVTRDLDVTMSAEAQAPDVDRLSLPAFKEVQTMEVADAFQSQGKKQVGNKARGTVKIYNFTRAPINLKSSTTVLTVNGKTYSLVADLVQVKPTRYANAATKEVDQSSLGESLEVVAAEGGEASNLPAGTQLAITNQVFGSKPQLLYAKTDTPITGGVSRYLSVVTEQDIAAAQNALRQKVISEVRGDLEQKGLKVLENAYTMEVTSFTSDKPVNSETPNFVARMSAKVTAMAFNNNDLANLLNERTKRSISEDKVLETDLGTQDSYRIKTIDFNANAAVVSAHFKGRAVSNVEVKNLPGQLVGKTPSEVEDILTAKPEIERIEVTLAPSWQKSFPWFAKKIEVRIE